MTSNTEFDLSTPEALLQYLDKTAFASHTVDAIFGGRVNFVYRIYLNAPYEGNKTFIVKYASPFLADSPQETPWDVARQGFEVEAMRLIGTAIHRDARLTIPAIMHYDDVANVVIMEDCGADTQTLVEIMQDGILPASIVHDIGTTLGTFLAQLHTWGLDPKASNHDFFDSNIQSKVVFDEYIYAQVVPSLRGKSSNPPIPHLPLQLSKAELDAVTNVCSDMCRKVHDSHQTVISSDFRPGNILIRTRPGVDGNPPSLEHMYIIDWETCRTGPPGWDVGHFAGELNLLSQFSPKSRDLASAGVAAFFASYRENFKVDLGLAQDAAMHAGAIAVSVTQSYPTFWGTEKCAKEVVEEGVEYLIQGHGGGTEWIRDSFFGPLLKETDSGRIVSPPDLRSQILVTV